ncbi:VOC family protein [Streptomyces atratus]|uniref:VOC family protein n=1 Tax=Streptomyces atratus TaxID=1893 RepID=UPI002B1DBFEE|nr:VOC family protein [Streptomyces atratus]
MPTLERIMPVIGAPCWVHLMAKDLRAAQSFYTDVMDWKFRASTLGSNFSVALAHGKPVAGVGCCSPGGPPAVWTPYFAVKNADETAGRISERGATFAVGPLPLGEGRAGIVADRDGATFGFWEGPDHRPGRHRHRRRHHPQGRAGLAHAGRGQPRPEALR